MKKGAVRRTRRRAFTIGFTKIPRSFVDSGVVAVIGALPYIVYVVLRRFERTDRSHSPTVNKMLDEGWRVAYLNQTTAAILLGLSRATVTRAVHLLKAVGWIREIRLKDNGRAYKLGFTSSPDSTGKVSDGYFADIWLERTLERMPDKLVGWQQATVTCRQGALSSEMQRVVDGLDDIFGSLPP